MHSIPCKDAKNKNFMTDINYYSFFDVDNTLVNIKTLLNFLHFYCCKRRSSNRIIGYGVYLWISFKIYMYRKIGKSREFLNNYYYCFYKNVEKQELEMLSVQWFDTVLGNKRLFNKEIVNELRWHQVNRGEVVFVSGSFFPCLMPLAKYLNVRYIISTSLEEKNGILTGKIIPPQIIGQGKVDEIRKLLYGHDQTFIQKCFAYGDDDSDIPMLELVGNPVVVGKNRKLGRYAQMRNWRII